MATGSDSEAAGLEHFTGGHMERKSLWKTLAGLGLLAVASILVCMQFLPENRAKDINRYKVMKLALEEIRAERISNPANLPGLQEKLSNLGKDLTAELKLEASSSAPAKQSLLFAARDDIPRFVHRGLAEVDSAEEQGFDRHLREAAYHLELEKRPPPDQAFLSKIMEMDD